MNNRVALALQRIDFYIAACNDYGRRLREQYAARQRMLKALDHLDDFDRKVLVRILEQIDKREAEERASTKYRP